MDYEEKIKQLGIVIPKAPKPVAQYLPAKKVGRLIFCSGQGPVIDGKVTHSGKLGTEKTIEEGYDAAKICVLNCLAAARELIGTLNQVDEIVKMTGFVNSSADFYDQPKVINGASDLLVNIFGEKGRHARCAIGTSVLPSNISVEVELILSVKE
jgi:enamine deaminase RidA (YjgF/YER057c/UK114 family)